MDKKSKIIIAVLVIVIVALVCEIGFTLFGDMNQTKSNNANVTVYNFDSAFMMEVPKGKVFKKSWNESDSQWGVSKRYDEKNNKFSIMYAMSPLITKGFVDFIVNEFNSAGRLKSSMMVI